MVNVQRAGLKPLSFSQYLRNNARKISAMVVALLLCVFMIVLFQMVFYVVKESGRLSFLARIQQVTEVFSPQSGAIAPPTVQDIEAVPGVQRVVPVQVQMTEYTHFFSTMNTSVYTLNEEDMAFVLERLGMGLRQGRLPQPGSDEIAVDWRVMNNQGKRLGDWMGREVNPREGLAGKHRIVGVLQGDCFLSVICAQNGAVQPGQGMLLFAQDGRRDAMDQALRALPEDQAIFLTQQYAQEQSQDNWAMIDRITGLASLAVLFVMAFASGNSSYAQYFSRRYEFSMLQAIGYNRVHILLRAAREIALVSLVGFAGGIALGLGVGALLSRVYFEPHGFPTTLLTAHMLLSVLVIPLSTALFGIIPVGLLLSRTDPLMAMDKFE